MYNYIYRQRQELKQKFDQLAILLRFNMTTPIPDRYELLNMAIDRIHELRTSINQLKNEH